MKSGSPLAAARSAKAHGADIVAFEDVQHLGDVHP
jgi:hypothetical protein